MPSHLLHWNVLYMFIVYEQKPTVRSSRLRTCFCTWYLREPEAQESESDLKMEKKRYGNIFIIYLWICCKFFSLSSVSLLVTTITIQNGTTCTTAISKGQPSQMHVESTTKSNAYISKVIGENVWISNETSPQHTNTKVTLNSLQPSFRLTQDNSHVVTDLLHGCPKQVRR